MRHISLFSIFVMVLFASCSGGGEAPAPADVGNGDDGGICSATETPCGESCCAAGERCEEGACVCAEQCEGRECGSDGCGGECGKCEPGESCEGGLCQPCVDTTDAPQFCEANGAECGVLAALDACGRRRTADCGECSDGGACDRENNHCLPCERLPDEELCALAHIGCGEVALTDNCSKHWNANCGKCDDDEICWNGSCSCFPQSAPDFCVSHSFECGLAIAPDNCGQIRRVGSCGACVEGEEQCLSHQCLPVGSPPPNDNCAGAERLHVSGLGAEGEADTSTADDSGAGSCGGEGGGDVVFSFTTEWAASLKVEATPAAESPARTIIYLKGGCGDSPTPRELGCAAASPVATEGNATLSLDLLPAGTWYLWVDSASPEESGAVQVKIDLVPLETPANDQCDEGELHVIHSAELPKVINGSSLSAGNEHGEGSGCLSIKGPDVVWRLELEEDAALSLHVISTDLSPVFYPTLQLVEGCTSWSGEPERELGCAVADSMKREASLRFPLVRAGTWWIVVGSIMEEEGPLARGGNFRLSVERAQAITNDNCEGKGTPLDISPADGLQSRVTGTTAYATDDAPMANCQRESVGADLVYSFRTPPGEYINARVVVTPAPNSLLNAGLAVRTSCAVKGSEIACANNAGGGNPAALDAVNLAPETTYYLWLDTLANGGGAFELALSFDDRSNPPFNVDCNTRERIELWLSQQPVELTGSTVDGFNRTYASCGGAEGTEAWYSVEVKEALALSAAVLPSVPSERFSPIVSIRRTCEYQFLASDLGCGVNDVGSKGASFYSKRLTPGNYTLVVDGADRREGSFALRLYTFEAPEEAGSCANPRTLRETEPPFDVVLHGDTNAGINSTESSCNRATAQDSRGKEQVYEFVVPNGVWRFEAQATPVLGSRMKANLFLRSACGDYYSELACQGGQHAAENSASLEIPKLGPGTYSLYVKGAQATRDGLYELRVALNPPTLRGNDACSTPTKTAHEESAPTWHWSESSTTLEAVDSGAQGIAGHTGGDLFYKVHLERTSHVTVALTRPPSSGFEGAVSLRRSCSDGETPVRTEVLGKNSTTLSFTQRLLEAGDYLIVVDSSSESTEGAFALSVAAAAAGQAPLNDSCLTGPEQIVLAGPSDAVDIRGASTEDARDDYAGRCQVAGQLHDGADVVYRLTVAQSCSVKVKATTAAGSPALYLRSGACADSSFARSAGCVSGVSRQATLFLPRLETGTEYFLVVDGLNGHAGAFDLQLLAGEPVVLPDSCDLAESITPQVGEPFAMEGTTSGAYDHARSTALGLGDGPDVVYRVGLTQAASLRASLYFAGVTGEAVLYVRRDCDLLHQGAEVASAHSPGGGPVRLYIPALEASGYYIWVDSSASLEGDFRLELKLGPPEAGAPENGSCDHAEGLSFASGAAVRQGIELSLAGNSQDGSCAGGVGPEVVYKFRLPGAGPKRLVATAARSSGSTANVRPVLYLKRSCEGAERACAAATAYSASLVVEKLEAGDWYLFVKSSATGGPVDLSLQALPPSYDVTNADRCDTAPPIYLDENGYGIVTGDTTSANRDANPVGACATTTSGRDLVFSLDTLSRGERSALITLTYPGGAYPALYLRGSCASDATADQIACAIRSNSGGALALAVPRLPAGQYYIWVDSASQSNYGAFTLTVQLSDPLPAAAPNDACADASPLSIVPGRSLTLSGTLVGADNSVTPGCVANSGGDLFYSFRLDEPVSLTAVAMANVRLASGLVPALAIRRTCADESDLACQGTQSAGKTTLARVLPADTYLLIVDGADGTSGPFTLTLDAQPVPSNTGCGEEQATRLVFVDDVATVLSTTNHSTPGAGHTSCLSGTGPEVVYSIFVPPGARQNFTARIVPLAGYQYGPVLEFRADCADPQSALSCTFHHGSPIAIQAHGLTGGAAGREWYLWVDSYSNAANHKGPFELTVTRSDSEPSVAGTCALPEGVTFSSLGRFDVVDRTFEPGLGAARGTCADSRGLEHVYTFTTTESIKLSAHLSTFSGLVGALYLRRATCEGDVAEEALCYQATASNDSFTLIRNHLPQDTWFLFVDAPQETSNGTYSLALQMEPALPVPAHDRCELLTVPPAAADLRELSIETGEWTITGSIDNANHEAEGRCGAMPGPDMVYAFRITDPAIKLAASVRAEKFAPSLYIRSACADPEQSAEIGCAVGSGDSVSLSKPMLPSGDYYVWIDSQSTVPRGPFVLTLTPRPIDPGENCIGGAIPLTLGVELASQSMTNKLDDFTWGTGAAPGCGTPPHASDGSSKDLVYSFVPAQDGSFTVTISTLYDVAFWVGKGTCGAYEECLLGVDAKASGNETGTVTGAEAGETYYIYVDGRGGSATSFKIKVTVDDP